MNLKGVLKGTVESTKMRAHFVESTKCARKSSKTKKRSFGTRGLENRLSQFKGDVSTRKT